MTHVTLTIAIIASLLILYLRPIHALAVCLTVLILYPTYLVVSLGTIDISAGRIIVSILLFKCLSDKTLINKFKWCPLDTWVVFYMLVSVIIPCISSVTHTFIQSLENRSGFLMDSLFIYILVRLCLVDRAAMITLIKWIGLAAIPLALLGIIETITGWQPFLALQAFCPWEMSVSSVVRFGFYRAVGPFPQPILFGTFFAMLFPLVYFLRNVPDYSQSMVYLLCGLVISGALSSMSSGAWLMIVIGIFCLFLEHMKYLVKPLIWLFIIGCLFVEIASNRHFYFVVVSYVNPLGGTGWYRAKLLDSMIQNFDEWWLVGYGGLDPGWTAMDWTDVCSMFVLNGVNYGILGMIGFCGIIILGTRNMVRLYNCSSSPDLRSWAWTLGSVLVIVTVASLQCGFRGQVQFLFYIILGIISSSSNLRPKVANISNKRS